MNEIKTNLASGLKLKRLLFKDLDFTRVESEIDNVELQMKISKDAELLSDSDCKVTLKILIYTENKSITIGATMIGFFEIKDKVDSAFARHIMETNTIAIMFPYLRSQISLITTQPDMSPIIIPALNINKLTKSDDTDL
ncbi:protein-export chaperone SecB [Caproiciproducens faecalis]|uniref:Protein-export chaperone SecB n=1 Tax=Caproiciproducens faecalis TaxID=2820301 RepID=A0ABS7DRK6_9FIRM|nr:protein-export chaperone SecB [Caproiciproducens faecalis]MBW7573930.1 protein-export chaperone SecB [Caproiciproducens faecalis]